MNFALKRHLILALILVLLPALSHAEDGLVAHYAFDEGSGVIANDSSGNGYNGTVLGGATWTSGVKGGALTLNGTNAYVEVPFTAALNSPASTVTYWVKLTGGTSQWRSLFTSRDAVPNNKGIVIYAGNNNVWQFWTGNNQASGSGNWNFLNGPSVTLNVWIPVAASHDGATIKFYVGSAAPVSLTCGYVPNPQRPLRIGAGSTEGPPEYFVSGLIDEVRIYNRALSAAEIAEALQVPPVATADSYAVAANQTLNTPAPGALGNDTDLNADTLTAIKDSDPAHGTLSPNSNGSFTYTPQNGFAGADSFTYHASDGHGNDSAIVTVTINVSDIPAGLLAWYKFDEGAGTIAGDSSGHGYAGTLINSPAWVDGVNGNSLSFNGTNTYVDVTSSPNVAGGSFTVSAWIYRANNTERKFVSKWDDGTSSYQFDCQIYSDSKTWFQIRQTNNNYVLARGQTIIQAQRWYHYCAVADVAAKTMKIYLNGVEETLQAAPGWDGTIRNVVMHMTIGRKAVSTDYWNGMIDDVRIYDHALTAQEAAALASAKPNAIADFYPVRPGETLNAAAPGVLANDIDANYDALTAVKDTDPAHGALTFNSDGSFAYTPEIGFTGTDTFTYHANDGKGNDSQVATVTITVADTPPGLIAWYKLDEGSGAVASDSSGSGNAGTLVNGPTWTTGVMGNALKFDGINDTITMPDNIIRNHVSISIALWFRTTGTVSIAGYQNPSGSNYVPLLYVGSDGKLRGMFWTSQGGNTPASSTLVNDGKWHHVAIAAAINTQSMYLDGALVGTTAATIDHVDMSRNQLGLGNTIGWPANVGSTAYFNGTMDDVRIYDRGLSAGEVSQLAQAVPTVTTTTGVFTAVYKSASQNLALSATVAASANPVTEGTVTFQLKNGAANVGTAIAANVVNGTASGTYVLPAGTPLGTYAIEAKFNGTVAFAASSDNSKILTVELAPTTVIAVNSAVGFSAADQLAGLNATVTSSVGTVNEGNVTFQIKNGATNVGNAIGGAVINGAASVSYTIPGGTALGTYTIEATFTGTNFAASSDNTHTLKVVEPNTMAAANASIAYKASSQNVTLNATITGAAGIVNEGTVTFQVKNGAANVGSAATSPAVSNGAASVNYTLPAGTPAGTYSIFASYSGGPNFPPSSDNSKTLTITRAATGTAPANATAPYSFADQNAALSVQVTSSAGVVNEGTATIQLKSGAQNLGTAVTSGTITNGSASVNYTIPGGTLPGVYTIQASYSGGTNFAASSDNAKTLTLLKATPIITWPNPADIAYGTSLGPTQLNAGVGGIPGTFAYNPPSGSVLAVGNSQQLSVTFTPDDTVNYNSSQKTVVINVTKKILTVTADNQSKLFGTPNPPLTASYSGFVNGETAAVLTGSPALSTSVTTSTPPGNYPITVAQGTLNAANYSFAFVNGTLTVSNQPAFSNLSAPNVPYKAPTTALSGKISSGVTGSVGITLNGVSKSATIDASGFFSANFDTSSLELGTYPIQYFYPGGGSVGSATDTRTLTVIKATPAITWANPAEIGYGTPLSGTQLNATANVAGNFSYAPPAGTVLTKGTHSLSTNFTPTDSAHYISASANVTLVVGLAQATITWATPTDISYGTALSDAQLNATADIAGAFTYNPPAGTILNASDAQKLSLVFAPDDNVNYAVSHVDVFINVLKAEQTIAFAQIPDQEIGSPALTLSATASSNLPVTISLVSGNATLQGTTLTLLGLGAVTLRAEQSGDANFSAAPTLEQTFQVIIIPPHFTSALAASGAQNQPFTFTLTATGTQPVTFESSTLPAGLSLNANSGEISGTPTGSGAFQIAVTARNGGGTETKTLTLVFASSSGNENHAPKFTSGALATPNPASVNLEVIFSAPAGDEDGDSVAIVWDFGDGTQGFGATTTHRYTTSGIFDAKVTITDGVASDYLNLTVVVNGSVIPPDQYKQYVVSKLGLKFNFAKPNLDSLSLSGTVPIPPAFAPEGRVVKFESGSLEREWTLDKKATSTDKAFKLTGKFAKDGTFTASPAKFALALKNQDLFTGLSPLGFVNDNTPKGMIVRMPVILVVEGTGYLATVDVKYAAKKDKSGSGKK